MNVGSVELDVQLSESSLTKAYNQVESKFRNLKAVEINLDCADIERKIQRCINSHIGNLNQRQAFKQVAINFDDREILKSVRNLEKQIQSQKLQIKLDSSKFKSELSDTLQEIERKASIQPKIIVTNSQSRSTGAVIGKEISKAINSALRGNVLSQGVDLIFGSIFRGGLENLGKSLTKDFNKGLVDSLKQGLNQSIGSTNLVGEKLGSKIVESIASNIPEELKEVLQTEINNVLGEVDITVENLAGSQKRRRAEERKLDSSRNQALFNQSEGIREVRAKSGAVSANQQEISRNQQAQAKGTELEKNLRATQKVTGQDLSKEIKEVSENLAALFEIEGQLLEKQEKLESALSDSQKKLSKLKETFSTLAPEQIPQAYAQALKDIAGSRRLKESQIPQLVVNDELLRESGATASYGANSNSLIVTSEMKKAIDQGRLTEKQLQTLYHELQHALDFDFGSLRGVVANRNNVVTTKPLTPNKQELAELTPFINRYPMEDRLVEMNAELSGRRKGGKAFERQELFYNSEGFDKAFGKNAEKFQNLVDKELSTITTGISQLVQFSTSKGVNIKSELKEYLQKIQTTKDELGKTSETIKDAQLGQLSTKEVKELENNIQAQLKQLEDLTLELQILQKTTIKKAKDLINIPLNVKEAEKVAVGVESQNSTNKKAGRGSSTKSGNKLDISIPSLDAFEAGMLRIKDKILPSFKSTFKDIQSDFGNNKLDFIDENDVGAIAKAKTLLESLQYAKADIEKTRTDLDIPKIGTSEASKLNQTLSQLKRIENQVKRELEKAKNNLQKTVNNDEENENLRQRLDPLKTPGKSSTEEEKKRIQELNVLINSISNSMDDFEYGFQKANKGLDESLEKSSQGIRELSKNLFNFKVENEDIGQFVRNLFNGIESFIVRFAGFGALVIGGKHLLDFAKVATQVSREMEILTMQVSNIGGGGSQGNKLASEIRQTAENLRLNIKDTMEASSSFIASTEGTSIEGILGVETFKNFQKYLASRAVTTEKAKNFLQGAAQAAGKGIQSEELRQQMEEAVGGTIGVFARSQGQNNRELLDTMKRTPGGLDQTVLFEASQQAAAEAELGISRSFETLDSNIRNVENKFYKLQETVGNVFLPIEKVRFKALGAGLDFVTQNAELLVQSLKVGLAVLTKPLWIGGLKLIQTAFMALSLSAKSYIADLALMFQIQTAGMGSGQKMVFGLAKGFAALKTSIAGIGKSFAPFLLMGVAIEGITSAFKGIHMTFADLSGETKDFAENADISLKKLKELTKTGKQSDETGIDFANNSLEATLKRKLKQGWGALNPFDISDWENVNKANDTLKATKKLVDLSKQIRQASDKNNLFGDIDELAKIDKKLNDIRNRKQAILKLERGAETEELKRLKQEEKVLIEQRGEQVLGVGGFQSAISARIDELKATKDKLTKQAKDGFILETPYKAAVTSINTELKELEKQQEKITKAIGKTKTAFDLLRISIQKTSALIADTATATGESNTDTSLGLMNQLNAGNLSKPEYEGLKQASELGFLQNQLSDRQSAITLQQDNLNSDESQSILKAFEITEKTGINELKRLAELVDNENQKFIIQQFTELQESKSEINDIQLSIATAQNQIKTQIKENEKQIAAYYRELERSIKTNNIEASKLNQQADNQKYSNQLKQIFDDGYETIIGSIVTGIEEAMNNFNSATEKALENQQNQLQTAFTLEDTEIKKAELEKQLIEIPPIELDFDSIPANENINEIKETIQKSIDNTNELNTSIGGVSSSVENVNSQFAQTNNEIQSTNDKLNESKDKILESNTNTEQWRQSTEGVKTQNKEINSSLDNSILSSNNLYSIFQNIVNSTSSWVDALKSGLSAMAQMPGIMGQVGGFFNNAFGGGNQGFNGSGSTGVIMPAKGVLTSPYGMRTHPITGNRAFHEGIDIGNKLGTPIIAPTAGEVTDVGYRGLAGNMITLKSVDSQGREIIQKFLHLQKSLVKVGDQVTQGQKIGTMGSTGGSTGSHLDWRMKINGEKVNPKEFLKMNINIPGSKGANIGNNIVPFTPQSGVEYSHSYNKPTKPGLSGIKRGGNPLSNSELSKLTALGQQLYQYRDNPNILAFGDTIARAEGTDFRKNSRNFGYSMLIGNGHDTDLSRHPFAGNKGSRIKDYIHNSSASGRYQMMDFNYSQNAARRQFGSGAKSDLSNVFKGENPGSFSPGVQDLYFIYSLKYRGILDEVLKGDFEGALKNPGIANHYASLQKGGSRSAYKNQGTPEGQLRNTIPFTKQRLRARGGKYFPNSNQFSNPKTQINKITTQSQTSIKSKAQAETNLNQAQQRASEIAGENALARVKRQTERSLRDLDKQKVSEQRALTDLKFDSIAFPTVQQQNLKESTENLRKYQDTIKDLKQRLEDTNAIATQADKAINTFNSQLESGGLNENQSKALQLGIETNTKLKQQALKDKAHIQKTIDETEKAFAGKEKARVDRANFEAYLRESKAAIEIQQQENVSLQEQISLLEKVGEARPNDARLQELPALKEKLSLSQLEVETANKLLQIEEEIKRSGSDAKVKADKEKVIEQLRKEQALKLQQIKLTRKQQEEELKLKSIRLDLDIRSKFADLESEISGKYFPKTQRELGKNGLSLDTGELEKARYQILDSQKTLEEINLQRQIAEVHAFGKEYELSPKKVETLISRVRELNHLKLDELQTQFDDALDSDKIEDLRKVRENLQFEQDLKQQSGFDLQNAQADKLENRGNILDAREIRTQIQRSQELFSRNQKLKELDEQVLEARSRGIQVTDSEVASLRNNIVQLSEINLSKLSDQFNPWIEVSKAGIDGLKGSIKGVIDGTYSLGDAFMNIGASIADSLSSLAAEWITNELVQGLLGGGNKKGSYTGLGSSVGGLLGNVGGGFTGGFAGGGILGSVFSLGSSLFGFNSGGMVPTSTGFSDIRNQNNLLGEALRKEGSNSVMATLTPGERVLTINEAQLYNQLFPNGIMQYSKGGDVGSINNSGKYFPNSNQNNSYQIDVNVQQEGKSNTELLLSKMLRPAIIGIIQEQMEPGGLLNQ